ncbi:tRNA-modifying protein YgfZ [Shewanella saliphila]|uniref:tRNA-modifying protein YgfZ n=1 Tax=Shewanella saliphila TaxID=2282698 RepID=A0ABQ2Q411_9GAMM|nr:tRNA-modifying protein YgfZ [Shewanella saliphila]MCL1101397.1 tRNA-modifying protein YgfZ [Shewanella saliphila]GGP48627.1 tRNA-modifying protein YgfZ [Shewanella saliphila]
MTISASQPDWDFIATSPALMLSSLSHMGLIEVTGEQGRSFIHGQVTTDITSLTADQWKWGAHCDPKGKMLASFRTFAIADSLFMLMPTSTLELDLPQLKKYAVFSKAELSDVSSQYQIIGVAGNEAQAFITQQFGDVSAALTLVDGGAVLRDGERFIVIITNDKAAALISASQQTLVDAKAWQALEIKAGYPNIDASHSGQYVAQMCNLQAIDGISFNKGCYMGQETIARMKYRGGNKRALYILSGTTSTTINTETQLEIALEDGFRRGGNIIECVQQGENVLLTAVLANDTENTAKLRIADDESSQLSIIELPYSLADA